MKRWVAGAGIAIISGVLIVALLIVSDPLRRSDAAIRESLLRETPLGAPAAGVLHFIQKKLKHGNHRKPEYNVFAGATDRSGAVQRTVGVKSIQIELGRYYNSLFPTRVFAEWAFDANDRLIGVFLHREIDAF